MAAVGAALLLALAAGQASAANISGTVTDAAGQPLPSKVVAAYSPVGSDSPIGAATTDSLGKFTLKLDPGSYRVLAYDPARIYATTFGGDADSFDSSPVVNVSGDISGMNFALRLAGTITGTVTSTSGTPLFGMTIAAYNVPSGTRRGFTQSATNGTYSLVLPPGQYKVAAYDPSSIYALRFFPDQPNFVTAAALSVSATHATSGANFQLSLAAHLTGSVVDGDTGLVLPNKSVIAYSVDGSVVISTATTDFSGNFLLPVPAGNYKIVGADTSRVYASGYLDDANSFESEATTAGSPGQITSGLRIPLHHAGFAAGRITDITDTALSGISVAAYNEDGTRRAFTQTDPTGGYLLLLPAGSFRIAAYDNSLTFATQFYPARRVFSEASPVPISIAQTTPDINFTLARGARFAGKVVDQATGAPVAGISVAAYDDEDDGTQITRATTDVSGNYALVLPSGDYKFAAFDNSLHYVTAYGGGTVDYDSAKVYQAEGGTSQHLDFALVTGIRVSGNVVDATEGLQPCSGIEIAALNLQGDRIATATSNNGVFNIVLTTGTYKLLAIDPISRYYTTYYNSAMTLGEATPVVVQNNGFSQPITILLKRQTRRRSVTH